MWVIRHKSTDTYFKNIYAIPGECKVKLVTLQEAFTFSDRDKAVSLVAWRLNTVEYEVREIVVVLV